MFLLFRSISLCLLTGFGRFRAEAQGRARAERGARRKNGRRSAKDGLWMSYGSSGNLGLLVYRLRKLILIT